ncbi:MAG: hypothetical protein DRQ39_11620 [Gammaproteobacteria bacterium]|nr:MAG: hypothetical protein DRQ39_11620 [Gammaproteobacteria bacterium]
MSIWDELQKHVSETYDTLSGGLLRNHKEGLLNLSPQQRTAVNKWREQDFGKDDSLIASTIRNPIGAVEELAGYIDKNVKLASGLTPYNPLDPYADARGALELAGMAELGSIPFAPKSAGGTLGTVAGYGTAKNIAKKLDKKYPDVDASISGNGEHFTLDKLIIDKANRKQGIGGHFMDDLTGYADDTAKQLRLTADGDFGGSKAGQKRFYKRHGFIENKGRNRDYEFKENMYREPDSQTIGDNDAFKIAQRNATLPVKDGGLGLPANNTAMDRAEALGFDIDNPVFHGTSTDFEAFDPQRAIGTNYWSTTKRSGIESGNVGAQGSGVIKEMLYRGKKGAGWKEYNNLGTDELIARGYDGLRLPERDGSETISAFFPQHYRDKLAAFDPFKRESANLLASGLLGSTVLGGLLNEQRQQPTTY